MNKQDQIASYLNEYKTGNKTYARKRGKFDKLFGDKKDEILKLIIVKSVPIKVVYDDLVDRKVIEDSPYVSFYQWVKNNTKNVSGEDADLSVQMNDISTNQPDNDRVYITEEAPVKLLPDSREMFYGFDMNNDPDIVTNPLPQMYEISKEYIFNIFKNDTSLNNEKIVYILLYEISSSGENLFKNVWSIMLMQDGENVQQYYNRLQSIIDSDGKYSFGITNATASISDIAFACGYDEYKIIR
ncbi:hypothetical protein [Sulfuricurvum sp.]|uniref:hypothetical protein n=1 Tax=Sulfuricurvum sp. TaxID=2025608 RepID=UPI002608F480|nr:hypothetical protein [Sulfuricurvum sp.]MDD2782343.1 hypothetical protein [Sulfuricurvum sp.]